MTESKNSVLLVDDDFCIHRVVGDALREAGFRVSDAEDGKMGFEMFLKGSFDAVITDRGMPQMGGEELAEEIKGSSPNTPVILITAQLRKTGRPSLFDEVL